jgi:hypothetical protein
MTVKYLLIESAFRTAITVALGVAPESHAAAEPFPALERVRRYAVVLEIAKEAKTDLASVENFLAARSIDGRTRRRIERAIAMRASKNQRGVKP